MASVMMGFATDFVASKLANHVKGTAPYFHTGPLYAALALNGTGWNEAGVGGVEPWSVDSNYARLPILGTYWSNIFQQFIVTSGLNIFTRYRQVVPDLAFPDPASHYYVAGGLWLFDAPTGGNCLWGFQLSNINPFADGLQPGSPLFIPGNQIRVGFVSQSGTLNHYYFNDDVSRYHYGILMPAYVDQLIDNCLGKASLPFPHLYAGHPRGVTSGAGAETNTDPNYARIDMASHWSGVLEAPLDHTGKTYYIENTDDVIWGPTSGPGTPPGTWTWEQTQLWFWDTATLGTGNLVALAGYSPHMPAYPGHPAGTYFRIPAHKFKWRFR